MIARRAIGVIDAVLKEDIRVGQCHWVTDFGAVGLCPCQKDLANKDKTAKYVLHKSVIFEIICMQRYNKATFPTTSLSTKNTKTKGFSCVF